MPSDIPFKRRELAGETDASASLARFLRAVDGISIPEKRQPVKGGRIPHSPSLNRLPSVLKLAAE